MAWADFEEKEYEIAFSCELATALPGTRVFASGTVLEKILGYDGVANPASDHPIWKVLATPRPKGVKLVSEIWGISRDRKIDLRLPETMVSLILQYKRPEYMIAPSAKQWKYWRQPYFRFTRSKEQQMVLNRINKKLVSEAVVRYAAPAFHTRGQLEAAILSNQTVSRSGFVAPSTLGRHKVWTYTEPGSIGRGNPNGTSFSFEDFSDVREQVNRLERGQLQQQANQHLDQQAPLASHLRRIAAQVGYRNSRLIGTVRSWTADMDQRGIPLTPSELAQIGDLAIIQTGLAQTGATWSLAASE